FILEQYIRTVTAIKEFAAGNLKASHVKVARSQSNAYGCGQFILLFVGWADTDRSLVVIRRLKSSPPRIDGHKTFEQPAVNYPQRREDGAVAILGIVQKMLNRNEI